MEIAVIVDNPGKWEAFVQDLGDLWEINKRGPRYVRVGNIYYRRIHVDDWSWRGSRPDKVYIYNCVAPTEILNYFMIHEVEIKAIWN